MIPDLLRRAAGANKVEIDPYFSSVSLLLHMDGTNGSTSFVDSGPNALAVTAVGTGQISTAQSKFGGAAGLFGSGGNYITIPSSSLFDFGAGDFTIEFWYYTSQTGTQHQLFARAANQTGSLSPIFIERKTGNTIAISWTSDGTSWVLDSVGGSTTLAANTWHHIAVTRTSGTFRIFINGVLDYTNSSSTASMQAGGDVVAIGRWPKYANSNGPYYIDDLEIVKGQSRYTSNFTPRAKALPNIYNPYKTLPTSGAALWLAGDDSSTLFTDAGVTPVKVNGDLVYQWNDKSGNSRHATQTTSGNRPTWVPPASGRNGLGALAFNGSQMIGSSFTSPLNFGTSDFTVECWIKPSSFSGNNILLYSGSGGFLLYFSSAGTFKVSNWGVADYITTSSAISTSAWTHVAVTRSGTTLRLFLNGTITNTVTNSVGFSASTFLLGWDNNASNPKYVGQLQNLLVYNGQALYTANFTPWMS